MIEISVDRRLRAPYELKNLLPYSLGKLVVDGNCAEVIYHSENLLSRFKVREEDRVVTRITGVVEASDVGIVEISHPGYELVSVEIRVDALERRNRLGRCNSLECYPLLITLEFSCRIILFSYNTVGEDELLFFDANVDKPLHRNICHLRICPIYRNASALGINYVTDVVALRADHHLTLECRLCRRGYRSCGVTENDLALCGRCFRVKS